MKNKRKPKHRKPVTPGEILHKDIDSSMIEFIKKEAAREFPEDEALQQVHISRKIISLEAKVKGMNLVDYVKCCSGSS